MSRKLLMLAKGEGLAFGGGFLPTFHHGQEAHDREAIWGQLSVPHLFLGLLLWVGSDLQEAPPEIPCALGKTSIAALLPWCTRPALQHIPCKQRAEEFGRR